MLYLYIFYTSPSSSQPHYFITYVLNIVLAIFLIEIGDVLGNGIGSKFYIQPN
jgi:hypothetical protein